VNNEQELDAFTVDEDDLQDFLEDGLSSIIAPYFDRLDEGQDTLRTEIIKYLADSVLVIQTGD
jgi:hypothetical protein